MIAPEPAPIKGVVHARLTDRREANSLIRTVRRARDKVFEADE